MSFFGGNFQAWKLHSAGDYIFLITFIAAGVLIFWIWNRHIKNQRNHASAMHRVGKRLRKLAGKPLRFYEEPVFHFEDQDRKFDAVMADKSGIFLITAFGRGTKVYGTPDGETWRLEDERDQKETVPNPLIALKDGAAALSAVLEEKGLSGVKISPMVVFADPFTTPQLYLGYGAYSTTYQELKGWYKKQAGVKEVMYDFGKVSEILDGLCRK